MPLWRDTSPRQPPTASGSTNDQVGEVLDKFFNARLKLHPSYHADLETEVAQSRTQIILNSNGLRLQ
jgi:hypothetical protein